MTTGAEPTLLNALSVDVEEYFQVSAFEGTVRQEDWNTLPSRVEAHTERLLDMFDEAGVQATFFVLGWIAERHPRLVLRLAERGHEVACHGYDHRLVYRQLPDEFRRDCARSRRILQDVSGQPVVGYRAPSFSIGRSNLWALDVLAETGFEYDSSLFPVLHDRYGFPGAPRHIHRRVTPGGHSLVEVPPSTVAFGRATLPVGGGGYLRIYPAAMTHWAIRRLNRRERIPAVVYLHPWELDSEQPRLRGPLNSRLRHYTGLRTFEPKLRDLLRTFRFAPLPRVIAESGVEQSRAPDAVEATTPDRSARAAAER